MKPPKPKSMPGKALKGPLWAFPPVPARSSKFVPRPRPGSARPSPRGR